MNKSIEINAHVLRELEYLVGFVLASVADGSRRTGAWERQLLEMMAWWRTAMSTTSTAANTVIRQRRINTAWQGRGQSPAL